MMPSQKFKSRGAFSLLETLFAIVVLAIILTPIPKLLQSISDSAESIAIKDVLFSSTAKIMQLSLYHWDERSQSETQGNLDKILDTDSSNFLRKLDGVTRESEHGNRLYFDSLEPNKSKISASPPISFKDGEESGATQYDDIDDWNGTDLDYNISRGENMKSLDFNLSFEVYYIKDNYDSLLDTTSSSVTIELNKTNLNSPDRNLTSNIKLIKVKAIQLNSTNPFQFELHYISTNIGDIDYESRNLN